MIVHSLRLLNIKSYGEGPTGQGVTITLRPGINRIAGKNGHGKSTLIESLGYALFMIDPISEERFNIATYLLRSGKKAGEIDVVFEVDGGTYRLERGLGSQNKRRAKIVDLADGSTEAEGDVEVENYLCRLLGLGQPARLSELFSKLIGVKQGRLALPFDSSGAEAKRYFEPLLDVEIFRQCAEKLKPVYDRFEKEKIELEKKLAAIQERIKHHADSPEKLKICQHTVGSLRQKVETCRQEKEIADQNREIHEKKEQAYREAKRAFDAAVSELKLATQHKSRDEQQLQEAREASAIAQTTQAGYDACLKADQSLRSLRDQQSQKSALERAHASAARRRMECEGRGKAACQQAESSSKQKVKRTQEAQVLRSKIDEGRKQLLGTKPEFDQLTVATQAAQQSRDDLHYWQENLEKGVQANAVLLATILSEWQTIADWNPHALTEAEIREKKNEEAVAELARKMTEVSTLASTLSDQLRKISGGVCPFLKEPCQQFDPKKVEAEISMQKDGIHELSRQKEQANDKHQTARRIREKLSKDEASLIKSRENLEKVVASLISGHYALYSSAVGQQLAVLRSFLPKHAAQLELPLLVEARVEDCYNEPDRELKTAFLVHLVESEKSFQAQAARALSSIAADLERGFESFNKERDQRLETDRDLQNDEANWKRVVSEEVGLSKEIEIYVKAAEEAGKGAAGIIQELHDLEEKLKAFANLDEGVQEQQAQKDRNMEAHNKYLGAKPAAARLEERLAAFTKSTEIEIQFTKVLSQKQDTFERSKIEYNSETLEAARIKAQRLGQEHAVALAHLQNAEAELKREEAQFAELEKADAERKLKETESGRLAACMGLTKTARQLLPKAAPLVAQHVCHRVAGRAQQIFNRINHDPVELEWNAERYSLRINPGDRRFAMLSGGEQTKLALAMTLAMIQEFSGLKFCVFDEPTYAVDADSRHKLADTIVSLQEVGESKLDQLLLVSHDDAFEGKIEHVVVLHKTTQHGTLPVLQL